MYITPVPVFAQSGGDELFPHMVGSWVVALASVCHALVAFACPITIAERLTPGSLV